VYVAGPGQLIVLLYEFLRLFPKVALGLVFFVILNIESLLTLYFAGPGK
jgi:hypothetical protein